MGLADQTCMTCLSFADDFHQKNINMIVIPLHLQPTQSSYVLKIIEQNLNLGSPKLV